MLIASIYLYIFFKSMLFIQYFGEVEIVHLTPGDVGDIKGEDNHNKRDFVMVYFEVDLTWTLS